MRHMALTMRWEYACRLPQGATVKGRPRLKVGKRYQRASAAVVAQSCWPRLQNGATIRPIASSGAARAPPSSGSPSAWPP